MSQLRPFLYDSVRLACIFGVDLVLGPFVQDLVAPIPQIVGQGLGLVVSGLIVGFIFGGILARATVNFEWVDATDRFPLTGPVITQQSRQGQDCAVVYELQVSLSRDSWVAKLLTVATRNRTWSATLAIPRNQGLRLRKERLGTSGAAFTVEKFALPLRIGADNPTYAWTQFALESKDHMSQVVLPFRYEILVDGRCGRLFALLVRRTTNVSQIRLIRS